MYREVAERPDAPLVAVKPTERFGLPRGTRLAMLWASIAVVAVLLFTVAYFAGGPIVGGATALMLVALVVHLKCGPLRPLLVVIDHEAKRVRAESFDYAFDELHYAASIEARGEGYLWLFPKGAVQREVAFSSVDAVRKTAGAINLGIASRYADGSAIPDGLAEQLQKVATSFPLSGLSSLGPEEQHSQLAALLGGLDLAEVAISPMKDSIFTATATVREQSVALAYNLRRERLVITARVASPHGHLAFIRSARAEESDGWEAVTEDVLVNGPKSRAAFDTLRFDIRDQITRDVARLDLRLNIDPSEVRVATNEGLRLVRDPKATIATALELVVQIGSAFPA